MLGENVFDRNKPRFTPLNGGNPILDFGDPGFVMLGGRFAHARQNIVDEFKALVRGELSGFDAQRFYSIIHIRGLGGIAVDYNN